MYIQADGMRAFLVKETTPGVPETPTAANTVVLRDGAEFPSQPTGFTAAKELANTRSVTDIMRNMREAGTVKLPSYLRPAGAAGSKPGEGGLLAALLGKETVNPGISVVYEPATTKDSYTLWIKSGDVVFFATGLAVEEGTFAQSQDGQPTADFSGKFMRLGWAGTDALNGALLGGETEIVVDNSDRFAVGARIQVGTSDNAGAGHTVTAINDTTKTLTVDPAVVGAQADDAVVAGCLVAPAAIGAPLPYRAVVKIDGVAVPWRSWEITVADPVNFISEVPADPATADCPSGFVPKAGRSIKGKIVALFQSQHINELRAVDADKSLAIDFTGNPAGKQILFDLQQGRYGVPELAKGDGAVERSTTYEAKATGTGENEIAITYS